jgi:hypothetical protein
MENVKIWTQPGYVGINPCHVLMKLSETGIYFERLPVVLYGYIVAPRKIKYKSDIDNPSLECRFL